MKHSNFIREQNRLRWVLLKARLTKRTIKVDRYLVLTMGNVYQRFCRRPGSWLLGKLLLTINRMLNSHLDHLFDYEAELQKLTTPISKAQKLLDRSILVSYAPTERKKLTVIIMHSQFRVPKAQLARMLEAKR